MARSSLLRSRECCWSPCTGFAWMTLIILKCSDRRSCDGGFSHRAVTVAEVGPEFAKPRGSSRYSPVVQYSPWLQAHRKQNAQHPLLDDAPACGQLAIPPPRGRRNHEQCTVAGDEGALVTIGVRGSSFHGLHGKSAARHLRLQQISVC